MPFTLLTQRNRCTVYFQPHLDKPRPSELELTNNWKPRYPIDGPLKYVNNSPRKVGGTVWIEFGKERGLIHYSFTAPNCAENSTLLRSTVKDSTSWMPSLLFPSQACIRTYGGSHLEMRWILKITFMKKLNQGENVGMVQSGCFIDYFGRFETSISIKYDTKLDVFFSCPPEM